MTLYIAAKMALNIIQPLEHTGFIGLHRRPRFHTHTPG
jgi:hypothetical protein